MAKKLVIVESPAKAKTIEKILGKNYKVMASLGHVRDLPQYRFGVNVAKEFLPNYQVPKEKKDTVKKLAKAVKDADAVYLATDPDREGEAISWHLLEASKAKDVPVQRVVFHEITKQAIKEAFESPRKINMDLVDAQQARRILDRVVGYRLSPLLWRKLEKGLSAGRVQSVSVRMIADREKEIQKFVPQEYWTIKANLRKNGKHEAGKFTALLDKSMGSKQKISISNERDSSQLAVELKDATYTVAKIDKKQIKRQPYAPFTTSTLQQESWRKLRFTAKRTMVIAQQLYEGLPIGSEGQIGLITYMRTDSNTVSSEAIAEARSYIGEQFGNTYVPQSNRVFKTKSKGAQEAHEAIRPTSVYRDQNILKPYLNADQAKLYGLIWKRMVASQMANAAIDTISIKIKAQTSNPDQAYLFRSSGSTVAFPGFLTLYNEDSDETTEEDKQENLPQLNINDSLDFLGLKQEQHFTQPPPRYTEASLIRSLEENGIGRPSTYAPTISTIQDRKYVHKDRGRILPTELGLKVNDLLTEHFPKIVDLGFTARMEEELDEISRGEREWVPVISEFYHPFQEALEQAIEAIPDEASGLVCELCGQPMLVRSGRRGRFIGCKGYPDCKNTRPLDSETKTEEPEVTDESCDKCGLPMLLRSGRNGKFFACSGFPKCKNTKSYMVKTGVICRNCSGDIIEKRSRKGSVFYGCSNYPDCTFTLSQKPLLHSCPACQDILVPTRQDGVKCIGCKGNYQLDELEPATITDETPIPA